MEPEVIFFDLITVSLQEKDKTDEDKIEIIEIAAKTQDKEFRKYILPTCPITPRAIQHHGIYKEGDEIFDRDSWRPTALPRLHPYEGLTAFMKWIDDIKKEEQKIILVAHNNKFFHSDILAYNLVKFGVSLQNYVHFSDSIHLMKKIKSIGWLQYHFIIIISKCITK